MEEVVVTGMGCVSSLGNDPQTLWENLLAGKSGVSNIEKMDTSAYEVHFASEVKEFDDSMYFNARDQKRYSRNIRYAVYAALHAVENSLRAWAAWIFITTVLQRLRQKVRAAFLRSSFRCPLRIWQRVKFRFVSALWVRTL